MPLNVVCLVVQDAPDLIAAGYGFSGFSAGNLQPGCVCFWSINNLSSPIKKIQTTNPVTALAASKQNPKALAVGTMDGSLFLYDITNPKVTEIQVELDV